MQSKTRYRVTISLSSSKNWLISDTYSLIKVSITEENERLQKQGPIKKLRSCFDKVAFHFAYGDFSKARPNLKLSIRF